MTINLGKNYLSTMKQIVAGPPLYLKILGVIVALLAIVLIVGVGVYAAHHGSADVFLSSLMVAVVFSCVILYTWYESDNQTLTPDMSRVEALSVFDDVNLEFNDANTKPDSKSVGTITLDDDSNNYKLAKATWDGNHTIKVKPVNKSGKAMLIVANYCRKHKVYRHGIHFKLRSYIYKTVATYTNEQGKVTLTANATNPDHIIRKIERK